MIDSIRMNQEEIINWLLQGDVAIKYQTNRDLKDTDRPDLRKRIASEGWGAQYIYLSEALINIGG